MTNQASHIHAPAGADVVPFAEIREPHWARYLFAMGISIFAWVANTWIHELYNFPLDPMLVGFAAIVATAAWAGFGPGLLTTAMVSAWCAKVLVVESPGGAVANCAIFCAEGIFISLCSRRLQRALKTAARSERWHRTLMETAEQGIWVVDAAGVITYANARMEEMLGARGRSLVGRRMEEFFFPDDLAAERIRFEYRLKGRKEQFDRRFRGPDDSELWVLACSNPVMGSGGEWNGVLSMMTDITERKRAEHEWRRSEERYRMLFNHAPEGIYQSTPDGRIVAANPMLLKMLGLRSEAELHEGLVEDFYVEPGVRSRLTAELERAGELRDAEYELRRRDGRRIAIRENARVVRGEDGRVLYYEGTLREITEQREIASAWN